MFGFGWTELVVLLVLGLFVFGPERLPSVVSEGFGMLRQLRTMARQVTDDLKTELGPEFADLDLADLHPRTLVAKHLLGEDDEVPPRPAPDVMPPPSGVRGAVDPRSRGPVAASALRYGDFPPWDPDAT